jgi:hypothetical protein
MKLDFVNSKIEYFEFNFRLFFSEWEGGDGVKEVKEMIGTSQSTLSGFSNLIRIFSLTKFLRDLTSQSYSKLL